jgi:hypothetical protein
MSPTSFPLQATRSGIFSGDFLQSIGTLRLALASCYVRTIQPSERRVRERKTKKIAAKTSKSL